MALALGSLALLLAVIGFPILFWLGTNSGNAEGWFKQLILNPIPDSVTNLKYGGAGGFESVRCFVFDASSEDKATILKSHNFQSIDPIREQKRFGHLFSEYLKVPVVIPDDFRAYRSEADGVSITLLVSDSSARIYALVTT